MPDEHRLLGNAPPGHERAVRGDSRDLRAPQTRDPHRHHRLLAGDRLREPAGNRDRAGLRDSPSPSRDHERACRPDVAAARRRIEEVGPRECVCGPAGHVDAPDERRADELRPPARSAVGRPEHEAADLEPDPRDDDVAVPRIREVDLGHRPSGRDELRPGAPRVCRLPEPEARVDQVARLCRDKRDVVNAALRRPAEGPPGEAAVRGEDQP
jgi:hypothetical protein